MAFCEKCGAELSPAAQFCKSCGAPIQAPTQQNIEAPKKEKNRPTRAWYLVPILLNIIGGIIGYFAVRKEDRQLANRLLIVGIVMFVLATIAEITFFAAMFAALSAP